MERTPLRYFAGTPKESGADLCLTDLIPGSIRKECAFSRAGAAEAIRPVYTSVREDSF
jgi:hypothetical protein